MSEKIIGLKLAMRLAANERTSKLNAYNYYPSKANREAYQRAEMAYEAAARAYHKASKGEA